MHFNLFYVSSTQIYLSNKMHKVTIYLRYVYKSPTRIGLAGLFS